jgi:hypothetical protein
MEWENFEKPKEYHERMEKIRNSEDFIKLVKKYSCGIDMKPEWCVWGKDGENGVGVLHWIRPCDEAEVIAYEIADFISTKQGGSARAEKTEWNYHREGKPPVYENSKALDLLIDEEE